MLRAGSDYGDCVMLVIMLLITPRTFLHEGAVVLGRRGFTNGPSGVTLALELVDDHGYKTVGSIDGRDIPHHCHR